MYSIQLTLASGKRTNMLGSERTEGAMAASSDVYADRAKRYLKAELKRAGVNYAELARRLTERGLPETEGSITVKINRGAFPAWFLIAAMEAIGASSLRLSDA
jgi:hypothetical protein